MSEDPVRDKFKDKSKDRQHLPVYQVKRPMP
jgi:hypothetical protein